MSGDELHDEIDPSALSELPIFPLEDVVLFPGAVLPLHIFEPRYREMTRDAMDSHQLLAMTRLRDDDDDSDSPPVHEIAGLGRIVACRETDDGRYYLLVRGLARVRIEEELPLDRAYRRVRAVLLEDAATDQPQVLTATEGQLVALCDRLADVLGDDGDKLRELVREGDTPGSRADLVTAALIADPDERQRLLETLDPADRMSRVIELIARASAEIGQDPDLLN
jgi:Lon protease-like protein